MGRLPGLAPDGRGQTLGINSWDSKLFLTLKDVNPVTPAEQAAYAKWLDQRSEREEARQERALGEEGVVPSPLWFVLLLSAAVVRGFVFLFADRGEGAFVQAVLVGAVTAMLVSGLLVVRFLDYPYNPGSGSLKPTAMEETLVHMDQTIGALGTRATPLCDAEGNTT